MSPNGRHHILTVLVENKFGVLARVAGLFSRRGYNIFSLAVSPTDDERFSRMTIVVDGEQTPIGQIIRQLDKLIPVVSIDELAVGDAIERELMLATISMSDESRDELEALVERFSAKVLDSGVGSATLMVTGTPEHLDLVISLLGPFGIIELQRTGRVALAKLEADADAQTVVGS